MVIWCNICWNWLGLLVHLCNESRLLKVHPFHSWLLLSVLSAGASICWVGINGVLTGFLALADSPWPEAAAAVRQLQDSKVVTAMLTGDSPGAADAVAAAVGLQREHVHASLMPQDKFGLVSLSCTSPIDRVDHASVSALGRFAQLMRYADSTHQSSALPDKPVHTQLGPELLSLV